MPISAAIASSVIRAAVSIQALSFSKFTRVNFMITPPVSIVNLDLYT